jgi:Cu2+-exporting ATPase
MDAITKSQTSIPACVHCDLPVPLGLIDSDKKEQFCCSGCKTAYSLIHQCGLDYYYTLRDKTSGSDGLTSNNLHDSQNLFEHFDDSTFTDSYVRKVSKLTKDGHEKEFCFTQLYLEGVHCPACVWLIEQLPQLEQGVLEVTLDYSRARASITWDPDITSLSKIARGINSLNYKPHPFRGADRDELRRVEERRLLARIAVAGACGGNVMILAVCLYSGMLSGIEKQYWSLFRWVSFGLTIPTMLYSASIFFKGALATLRAKQLHMDLPITIGITIGFLASAINTIRGSGEVYFDSLNVLVLLLITGRWLQFRGQRIASERSEVLYSLLPSAAHLLENGIVRDVALESITPGQEIRLLPGETVPVDAVILEGSSMIDLSALTGESCPVHMEPGDKLHAGLLNLESPLDLEVSATGENTRLGRLSRLVEESSKGKAPIALLADKISGYFVAAVLILAFVGFLLGLSHGLEEAFSRFISLLIISCPCALGLATPLALASALGSATKLGIYIKSGNVIEAITRAKSVVFDKTGTLTQGQFSVVEWYGNSNVKHAVRAIEVHSTHAIAQAFVRSLVPKDEARYEASNVKETFGAGICGDVGCSRYFIGSVKLLSAAGIEIPQRFEDAAKGFARAALTPIFIAENKMLVAVAALGDPLQPTAERCVGSYKDNGFDTHLLSGDEPTVVNQVAQRLGVAAQNVRGAQSPEDKLARVEALAPAGVLMFGDGVNDAAALGAATVGVAVHGGIEASVLAADVFFVKSDIRLAELLLDGAKRTMAVIKRNLAISLAYNVIGAGLALSGYIGPLAAAIIMPISSLSVVLSSMAQKTFRADSTGDMVDADPREN